MNAIIHIKITAKYRIHIESRIEPCYQQATPNKRLIYGHVNVLQNMYNNVKVPSSTAIECDTPTMTNNDDDAVFVCVFVCVH